MTSGQEDRLRRGLDAVVYDVEHPLPEEPWPDDLPAEVEDLLWDYAMGSLEPPEEDRAIAVLARSPRAELALAQIRQSMAAAGMALPIEVPEAVPSQAESLLGLAWQKVRAILAALGGPLASLAAVVVSEGKRLIWAQEEPGAGLDLRRAGRVLLAPQPVFAGEPEGPEDPSPDRIEIPGSQGLSATVVRVSGQRVDVLVTVLDPAAQGTVRMFELTAHAAGVDQSEVGVGELLREGKATFEDCPAGMLKIVAPDGRELSIFLETGNR